MKAKKPTSRLGMLGHRLAHPKAFFRSVTDQIDDLTFLANRFRSDKGDLWFDRHNYSRLYSVLFAPLRDKPVRILEIGLLNRADRGWKNVAGRYFGTSVGSRAPSMQMWSEYFPQAAVFGFDINEFAGVNIERCKIYRGDMAKREDLDRFIAESGGHFDIIIDDASHASHHEQIALGYLFQHLNPSGLYVIEDLHYQPGELEQADAPETRVMLRAAARSGEFVSPYILPDEAAFLKRAVSSVELYDSATVHSGDRFVGAIAVLRRRTA
jgi:hypothetical protein